MTVLLIILALIIGFQVGVRGTKRFYEDYLDSLEHEINQSEEDFLNYAKADKNVVASAYRHAEEGYDK